MNLNWVIYFSHSLDSLDLVGRGANYMVGQTNQIFINKIIEFLPWVLKSISYV